MKLFDIYREQNFHKILILFFPDFLENQLEWEFALPVKIKDENIFFII